MSDAVHLLSASEIIAGYRRGALSPVDVTHGFLDRIEDVEPRINAFVFVDEGAALASARASEHRWSKNAPLGPLDGVPVAIKDNLLTKGWPTLFGSRTVAKDQAWDEDSPVVARLRESGAVFLGKTTTPEFCWKGVTDSLLTGTTRNPWNTDLTPGGSSGGSAAAVAAGMTPLALGSDAGGSVRIPACFSGIVGLKASFGRVPFYPASSHGTVDHVGPMTWTVRDAALMLNTISQPDWRDWTSLPAAGPATGTDYLHDLGRGVEGLTIAFSMTLGYGADVAEPIAAPVRRAVQAFRDLGARVEEVDPGFADPRPIYEALTFPGIRRMYKPIADRHADIMDPGVLGQIEAGASIDLPAYLDAVEQRSALGRHMREFHQRFDLLVTPTLPITAFRVGKMAPDADDPTDINAWTPYTAAFNLTGQPAISVPCGLADNGMPVGLQLIGPMHGDALVLRAACALEHEISIGRPRPCQTSVTID